MTATGNRIKCMVKDSCNGLMVENFQDLFTKIQDKVLEHIAGQMAKSMLVNGEKIKWMA